MHIHEIIIDGFKSYARRTVVEGFDPHFNAITGLNGSGKSNILDAICFVLGITNLSQVRAGNLSELVYKQGQAGVNKATVTIIFNNEDAAASPVGYEESRQMTVTRQVLLGGKSKYLINGRNVTASQVQNLFHSVQLNVNNPHFLIMQGRITKVLNMKPNEILGMVEEAAGTRMYETKRVQALKTITKKQLKLDELNGVLNEEITPTLERLRGEKEAYLRWSKNQSEIARMERFFIASKFLQAQKALESNNEGSAEIEDQVQELEDVASQYMEQVGLKQQEIDEASAHLRGEFDDNHAEAKTTEEERSKELVKITSKWKHAKANVEKADTELEVAVNTVTEIEQAVATKQTEMENTSASIQSKVQAARDADENVAQLTTTYQNMSAGISTGDSDEGRTLPEQISKAHGDSKNAQAKVEQAKMKIKHLTKELKTVEKEIKKQGKSSKKMEDERNSNLEAVEKLQGQLNNLDFSVDEFNGLEQRKADLDAEVNELVDTVEMLSAKLEGRLNFEYSDPVKGFDRSKVKGLVAKLITVKDRKHATAIEIAAGGKLYQVVVDEAITGKALLSRGKLKRRVTIIPLDKIRSKHVSHSANEKAKEIAASLNSASSPAIELVGFDEEIRLAAEYVVGSTIVVEGMRAANQICDATKTRTVTHEGDVYDPSGTISGGSNNKIGTTLAGLADLAEATALLNTKRSELNAITKKLKTLSSQSSMFDKANAKLEVAKAALKNVEKHLSQTSYGMLIENRDSMSSDLVAAEEECTAMQQEQEDKWNLYQELKTKETELTQQRENRLAEIEQALKDAKADATKKNDIARGADSLTQTCALEIESLEQEVETAKHTVADATATLEKATTEEAKVQIEVGDVRALYEKAKADLNELDSQLNKCSARLVDLKHSKVDLSKKAEEAKLKATKLSVEVERIRKERAGAKKQVESMLKKYPWIESEQSAFGVPGGDYDFDKTNPKHVENQLKAITGEQDSLSKKINKKVMGLIEKAEGEYTELLRKRKVVENDKKKIQTVIEELDVKKKVELQRTWVKVNRDFGSIFSTLLPGAFAKLKPPDGMEAWEGLEVKVAFGDVWKESLSELSGGQRSLLALSLILSLLLYKPAPMYILDEVDAALDLSHTQNIGNMLKTHFSQSQFIVVSLKEGMFNNANVIFRTKFVDGVSTVTRTIGVGSSRNRALTQVENDGAKKAPAKPTAAMRRKRKDKENTVAA